MRVEILMAAYNGEDYLQQQIDSILNQDCDDWHLTVSDDGSTDHTIRIINAYVARYPSKIQLLHSGKHFGNARDHFFWLMKQCSAEFMMFCDQDDVWLPGKVSLFLKSYEALKNKNTPVLIFSDLAVVDENLNVINSSLSEYQRILTDSLDYRSILLSNVVTGCACGINRALKEKALQCKDPSSIVMHDFWLAVVAARFGKIKYLDVPTVLYRQHGTNNVGAKDNGSIYHAIHQMTHLKIVKETITEKKKQARVFLDTYQDELNEDDKQFLNTYIQERSGIKFYWQNRDKILGTMRLLGMMCMG